MLKKYCDVCGNELEPQKIDKFGAIITYEKVYHIPQTLGNRTIPDVPEVRETTRDLCDKCTDIIITSVEKMTKEHENSRTKKAT